MLDLHNDGKMPYSELGYTSLTTRTRTKTKTPTNTEKQINPDEKIPGITGKKNQCVNSQGEYRYSHQTLGHVPGEDFSQEEEQLLCSQELPIAQV